MGIKRQLYDLLEGGTRTAARHRAVDNFLCVLIYVAFMLNATDCDDLWPHSKTELYLNFGIAGLYVLLSY